MQTLGEIQPGQTLGRYEFLIPIAQGGMAAVWAARLHGTRGFSKTVAIKTMLPTISDDPMFEQMFLDEATLASSIRHPNVCQIQDLGEQNDILYLVMEWVDGEPLSALRRAAAKVGGVPRHIAVRIVADACAGLHAAHELKDESGVSLGLVHRDISPQNILITYDGVVKIVDFGVAKAAGRSATITGAGQIKGKPPYMSPEQALGEAIDRRTDLFALGIILYQLTTGKHPFRGETDVITLQNIVSDRPVVSPRALDNDYPKSLETVVMRALARNPNERFQTAAEFEAALDRVFPPNTPRLRTDEVGRFVTELLGSRGEERREALRAAIRTADERFQDNQERMHLRSMPDLMSQVSLPRVSRTHTGLEGPVNSEVTWSQPYDPSSIPPPPSTHGTPYGTEVPAAPPRKSRLGLVVGGVMTLTLLAGGAALLLANLSSTDTATTPTPALTPQGAAEPADDTSAAAPEVATPEESGLNPDDLAQEQAEQRPAAERRPGAEPAAKPEPAPAPQAEPKPDPKPEPKPEPKPKPTPRPGFVPPQVTDPGF